MAHNNCLPARTKQSEQIAERSAQNEEREE